MQNNLNKKSNDNGHLLLKNVPGIDRRGTRRLMMRRERTTYFSILKKRYRKLYHLNDQEIHFPSKAIWAIFLVLSTSLCVFMVVNNIAEFRRFEVITKMRIVDEKPAPFPEIVICNKNPFVSAKANEFLNQFRVNNTNSSAAAATEGEPVRVDMWQASLHAKNPSFGDENRRSLGLNMQDMLIKCSFAESRCSSVDFDWFYDWDFGNCYRFNSGRNASGYPVDVRTVQRGGRFSGLYLQLFIGRPQLNLISEFTSGILLLVNNQSIPPSLYEGINAQPGTITNVDIKRVFTNRKAKPHSNCQRLEGFKSLLYNEIIASGYSYRQKDCFDLCKQFKCIELCKCYDLRYSALFNAKPCLNMSEIMCSETIYEKFLKEDIDKQCSPSCPLECDSVNYELSLSTASYPTRVFANVLSRRESIRRHFGENETITYEKLKESVLALDINFAELKYTLISESASKSIVDLIASIGGTIGLFLGTSLLGIVDVIEAIYKFAIILRRSKRRPTAIIKNV